MYHNEIPTSIETNFEKINFAKILRDFATTEYGDKLKKNIRWARYKPENTTNDVWENLLGVDANNLKHLRLSYGLARQFIKHLTEVTSKEENKPKLNQKEQKDLLLAAIIHDWAEAIVGDIHYDIKTEEDEDNELTHLEIIIKEICEQNNQLFLRMKSVINEIIKEKNTKLGKMFNAIERIGYIRTALHAWKQSSSATENLKTNLEWLINSVFSNQIVPLIIYSEEYPSIALYLKENKELIKEIFDNLPKEAFSKYPPEEKEVKKKEFNTAKEKWEEFYRNISL